MKCKNKFFTIIIKHNILLGIESFLFIIKYFYMNYNEWEIRVRRTMMAMEDLAVDLNIAMEEIEKWEKEGKVPKKAIRNLQWFEKD